MARAAKDVMARSDADGSKRTAPAAEHKWLTVSVVDDAADVIASVFDEACRGDPARHCDWIALVDANRHQIDRIQAEAKQRQIDVPIICDFVHVLEYLWGASGSFFDEGGRPACQSPRHAHASRTAPLALATMVQPSPRPATSPAHPHRLDASLAVGAPQTAPTSADNPDQPTPTLDRHAPETVPRSTTTTEPSVDSRIDTGKPQSKIRGGSRLVRARSGSPTSYSVAGQITWLVVPGEAGGRRERTISPSGDILGDRRGSMGR